MGIRSKNDLRGLFTIQDELLKPARIFELGF